MRDKQSAVVVGCGSIGTRHIENLSELGVGRVIAVDTVETRLTEATDAGADATFTDLDTALTATDPAVGLVCVPNHVHVPVARTLVEADVDLFVEKPLSHDAECVVDLVDHAKERDLVTMVGCNLLFHPGLRTLRERLQSGSIGTPTAVRIEGGSYLPGWHPDEDYREMYSARRSMGGGAILDYIHEINYARWLFGRVDTVAAMAGTRSDLEIETEDTAAMLLQFRDGPIGELHVDYVQRPYHRSCKIIGTDGTLRWDWHDGAVGEYDPATEIWDRHELPEWKTNDMYLDEVEHFMECVRTGAETECDLQTAWHDLRVALAAKRSAVEGSRVRPASVGD